MLSYYCQTATTYASSPRILILPLLVMYYLLAFKVLKLWSSLLNMVKSCLSAVWIMTSVPLNILGPSGVPSLINPPPGRLSDCVKKCVHN